MFIDCFQSPLLISLAACRLGLPHHPLPVVTFLSSPLLTSNPCVEKCLIWLRPAAHLALPLRSPGKHPTLCMRAHPHCHHLVLQSPLHRWHSAYPSPPSPPPSHVAHMVHPLAMVNTSDSNSRSRGTPVHPPSPRHNSQVTLAPARTTRVCFHFWVHVHVPTLTMTSFCSHPHTGGTVRDPRHHHHHHHLQLQNVRVVRMVHPATQPHRHHLRCRLGLNDKDM